MVSHKKVLDVLKQWKLENESISDVYHESNGEKSNRAFYVGKDFVLKFSKNSDEVKKAIALCNAIKCTGLCISSPIKTTDGRAYVQDGEMFFYLTWRISGTQMIAHDFYEGDYVAKARFVGEIIAQLHLILCQAKIPVNEVNLYESVKNWALPKSKDILSLSESFCRGYLNEFGKLYDKLPKQIIHRDPNPSNIIVSQDEWGFIDFELSEKNLRIYDPCYAAMAILSESFDEKDQAKLSKWLEIYRNILWGYDSVAKLTNDECVALPYVVMADQLISTAWFSKQDKFTELFETNKRMTQWLITIFDELKLN
ncbi:MAG: phosphotransferase [Lachnospiraceae bacterium]|nr:phosphotransferase [Lachnospiraceae bacterium]